ncbi:FadR family transcriptional regulator [Rhizobium sp. KVB221]|uniref:FadR family transcriptional regulator n=1 Tax=Rhizobium setariae TaxID=2801340 RepID=A0A937CJW9_9HYPH|nr:FadR/GntR family transcriptional regulator [Rhizobium setariae]MBL0371555.1 FadR family transcriptional regulator [Rhizobium setariae]
MTAAIERGKPMDGASLVSAAIGAITRHIRENELAPGDKLPSEATLSKELNVSRTVIREAFQSLAAMRLIELAAGKRATVCHLDHGAMSLLIEHGVHTEQINVQQIYDVRRTIEMRTATLAALRRTDAEAKLILSHAKAMKAEFNNSEAVMEHDLAFHLEIAKASRNPIFWLIVGAFQDVIRHTWPVGWKSRPSDAERHDHNKTHLDLAEAIAAGDPQTASQLMAKHFDDSIKALLAAGVS